MSESKRGGARTGSGRKPKEPTTTINFRVPVNKVTIIKPLVSVYIKGLLNNGEPVSSPQIQDKKVASVKVKEKPVKKPVEKEPTKAELWAQMNKNNQGL